MAQIHKDSIISSTLENNEAVVVRPAATYHPSVWGDFFLAYASHTMETFTKEEEQELNRLKDEVQKMFTEAPDETLLKLELIDNIQRLGVAYQFEEEIEASLLHIYNSYEESVLNEAHNDLHTIALRFRLLRQHGYYVTTEVFNKFLDPEGEFKASLLSDVKGMLNLFEAAIYGVHGENILDEALRFTKANLESMSKCSNDFIANKINQALKTPFHKTLTRVGARQYISIYQQDESQDELLLNFAKLDFNRLQRLHQKELSILTVWWKGLDFKRKLPFARDRLVECYFWILGVYFEPQFWLARKIVTKVIAMASTMDDIYDVYGTPEELIRLTSAIQRWNLDIANDLPPYMSHFYHALLEIYSEMEEELAKESRLEHVHYAKVEMKKLASAYYQEACWSKMGYIPTVEEYMKTAIPSSGYLMVATTSYMGMGDMVSKEVLDWASSEPLIFRAAAIIARLMDDIVGHETEEKASAVECYMKEHNASKEEAIEGLEKQITNAWKDLNQECLRPTAMPMVILERVLNLARVIHFLYSGDDHYTHSNNKSKNLITSVLVDPIII